MRVEPRLVTGPHHVSDPAEIHALPRPPHPTFFFLSYSIHGYGHLARSHRIASAFVERASCDAVVVSSHSDFSSGGDASRVHEISLPSSGLAPDPGGSGKASPTSNGAAELLARRSQLLLDLVKRFRPRGILIDHFPFPPAKAGPECEAALAWLRDQVPEALLCAGFRGVLTRPYPAVEQRHVQQLLGRYVDLFLVYVDAREEGDLIDVHPFLRPILPRTRFVGYVCPPRIAGRPNRGRILATFGAGIDAYPKIRLVCDAFRILARTHPQHTLDVVTGSRLPDAEYREIEQRYGGAREIRVTRFLPGLSRVLGEYELVVTMAGYNTLTELYQSTARSIVLPRSTQNEQPAQALKFKRYGAVDRVIEGEMTSADALAAVMEEVLTSPPPVRQAIDVDGAMMTARILGEELARRAHMGGTRITAQDGAP